MKPFQYAWVALMTTTFALILLYFCFVSHTSVRRSKKSVIDSIFKTSQLKNPKPVMKIKKFQGKKPSTTTQMPSTSEKMATTTYTSTQNVVMSTAKPVTTSQTSVTSANAVLSTKRPELSKAAKLVVSKKMTRKDRQIMLDLLQQFVILADRLNLTYFIYGGTLLGSWRHHGMIPWDDDIDVFVNETQKPQLLAAIKKLEPRYLGPDTKPVIKFYANESRAIAGRKWRWPFIDICFFKDNKTVLWDTIKFFSGTKFALDKILPLHKRPFETFELYAPRDSLYMIEKMYKKTKSNCTTWIYSHITERAGYKAHSVSCEWLKDVVPFVHRKYLNGTMEEELRLGSKVIHTKYVLEERSSLCRPYDLTRI